MVQKREVQDNEEEVDGNDVSQGSSKDEKNP